MSQCKSELVSSSRKMGAKRPRRHAAADVAVQTYEGIKTAPTFEESRRLRRAGLVEVADGKAGSVLTHLRAEADERSVEPTTVPAPFRLEYNAVRPTWPAADAGDDEGVKTY